MQPRVGTSISKHTPFAATRWLPIALALLLPLSTHAMDAELQSAIAAYERREAPVADTWITSRVRASLQRNADTAGLDIRVSTDKGVVTLTGEIDSSAQLHVAFQVAMGVKDVRRVDVRALRVRSMV